MIANKFLFSFLFFFIKKKKNLKDSSIYQTFSLTTYMNPIWILHAMLWENSFVYTLSKWIYSPSRKHFQNIILAHLQIQFSHKKRLLKSGSWDMRIEIRRISHGPTSFWSDQSNVVPQMRHKVMDRITCHVSILFVSFK